MNSIRICYFIGSLKIGGAQKHLVELINCLDRDKFDLFLVLGKDEDGFNDLLNLNEHKILRLGLSKYYDLSGLKGIFKLIEFLKTNKINILHSYLFECNIYSSFASLFIPKMKFIMSIRNMNYTHGRSKVLSTYLASMQADYVTVVCDKVGDFVINREKINPNKLVTLYNAVDDNVFSLHKHNTIKNQDTLNIVCVASLNFRKGHEYLIEAITILLNKDHNIQLYLLGDGKNRSNLEQFAASLGIAGNVSFAGYVTNVREHLLQMDIGVLSSFEEGMSNALLEYMAIGLPVVTTDVGGNREVNIDRVTGFVIPPKDSVAMAYALEQLITSDDLRHDMGIQANKRIAEYFSINNMKQNYTSFYLDRVNHI
ncbi:MAG: glycosyltransferase [Candidatus Polarisedimenticolaceae bacterium]|nr:glycosyltransferase [Candidatus Polarisedimenticolaceae bacterium]